MGRLECECGKVLAYEARHAGKKVRCPECRNILVVPGEAFADVIAVEEEPPRRETYDLGPEEDAAPARRSRRDEEFAEEERRRRREEEFAEEERPSRRRRGREPVRPSPIRVLGALLASGPGVAVLVVLGIAGIGSLIYGFNEGRVSSGATEKPVTMTCQQLINGGIPSNPHVLISEVIPGDNYVYNVKVTKSEKASGNTHNKPWDSVYLPLLPLTPELKTILARGEKFVPQPPANQVRVIMMSRKAKNLNDLTNIFSSGVVQGMIVNSISKLDTQTENLLRQAYPGVDLNKALIFEEGRKPSSQSFAITMISLGAVMIVMSLLLGGLAIVFRSRE